MEGRGRTNGTKDRQMGGGQGQRDRCCGGHSGGCGQPYHHHRHHGGREALRSPTATHGHCAPVAPCAPRDLGSPAHDTCPCRDPALPGDGCHCHGCHHDGCHRGRTRDSSVGRCRPWTAATAGGLGGQGGWSWWPCHSTAPSPASARHPRHVAVAMSPASVACGVVSPEGVAAPKHGVGCACVRGGGSTRPHRSSVWPMTIPILRSVRWHVHHEPKEFWEEVLFPAERPRIRFFPPRRAWWHQGDTGPPRWLTRRDCTRSIQSQNPPRRNIAQGAHHPPSMGSRPACPPWTLGCQTGAPRF